MESIKDKVAIVGMGCTKFGENWDMSTNDMLVDAAYEAYEDAGIEPKDIQAAWLGSLWSSVSGQGLAEPLKLQYIPVTRVENFCASGSDAIRNAAYAIAAGACDIALAIGVEKLKDSGYSGLPDSEDVMGREHTFRDKTFTATGHFAMMATRYFSRYGIDMDEGKRLLSKIAVKNHYNGSLCSKAMLQKPITIEDALNARMVAYPLGLYDCCGVSDGASAAILTRADMAKSFRPDPIYIKALQISVGPRDGQTNTKYDFTHVEETYRAGMAAYQEAGIKNPREEISIANIHDCFTITEAVDCEDLQFSPRGRVREDIEAGTFELNGKLPVNTDGGLKCFGHPIGASGLRMMYEIYKQFQGKGGKRQVKKTGLGLTHNLGGSPGWAAVSVLIVGQ
jgi:acetyl-CoA C-acetyltransferase